MKRYIYTAMIIAAAAVSTTAQAQQKVNLNKGDQKVVTVELGENDYIAFSRPAGVLDQRLVEIVKTATTKNSVKYTILAKTDDQFSWHYHRWRWVLRHWSSLPGNRCHLRRSRRSGRWFRFLRSRGRDCR